jgi:ankyrin repeat protein
LEYWESSSFKAEPTFFAAELDSTPHIPATNNETSQRESHKNTEAPTRETPRLPTKSREVQHAVQNDKHDVKLPTRQEEAQSSTGERPRSKQEQFVDAAKDGKLDEVRRLLQSGASVQKKYSGWTALGRAAREGHEAVVKFLVENGADLNVRMDVGWGILPGDGSALTWAAGGGHLEVVRYLVARGANLDIQAQKPVFFGTGGTAVTMASGKGRLYVVEYLLESGADKENKDGIPGWDAFICACDQGQLKVVEFFVETRKVNIHRIDRKGQTPIFAASLEERYNVMEYLVVKGASLNTQDFNEDSLLHHVATKGKKRTAVWLRRRGANLKAMNKACKTPLDLAIKRSQETEGNTYEPLIESLDWKKPEPDCDDEDGGCSLM